MSIRRYFDELKLRLMIDPGVELFEVVSEKTEEKEGYLRVVIKLPDDSVMHCFEYVLSDGSIGISKYSFHWQDAVRRLEIIGEAIKNMPADFREQYPDIPWRKIAGMWDVLIHGYADVNLLRCGGL